MGIALRRITPFTFAFSALAVSTQVGCFEDDPSPADQVYDTGAQPTTSDSSACPAVTHAACLFVETDRYEGTSSPLTVDIDTASPHAVPKNFVGANSELTATAMDWGNGDYQQKVKSLGLSWVRYSAGTLSDAFDWTDGTFRWGDQFPYINKEGARSTWTDDASCLWDARHGCDANWGTEAMYSKWNTINQAKTGKMQLPSWFSFAKATDLDTFVDVNVFTDTPESAGKLAKQFKDKGVTVALFEMGNEEYLYSGDKSWKPAGGKNFFADTDVPAAWNYLDHVKPYADQIKANYPGAHISISLNGSNNAWEADIANWTRAQTDAPFFDTLDAHVYGADGNCPFIPGTVADPSNTTEECMNYALITTASNYPSDVLNHPGCGSASSCSGEGSWRAGFAKTARVVYTELNADLEGGDGAQIVIPTNTRRGTMLNAVFLAEFVARTASCSSSENCSIDHVTQTGIQDLYGNWFGLLNSVDDTSARYELLHDTFKGDTETHDYGVFLTAPGLAVQVLSGAIPRNVSVNSLATKVATTNAPTVRACNPSLPKGEKVGVDGCSYQPAINAFTFVEGTNKFHTLVFNRGEHFANIDLQINGKAIHPTEAPTVAYVGNSNAQAANTVVSPVSEEVAAETGIPWATTDSHEVCPAGCDLSDSCSGNGRCEGGSHFQVRPYSVARIDWTESTSSSSGGGGTSGGSGTGSSGSCGSTTECFSEALARDVPVGTCIETTGDDTTFACVTGCWQVVSGPVSKACADGVTTVAGSGAP